MIPLKKNQSKIFHPVFTKKLFKKNFYYKCCFQLILFENKKISKLVIFLHTLDSSIQLPPFSIFPSSSHSKLACKKIEIDKNYSIFMQLEITFFDQQFCVLYQWPQFSHSIPAKVAIRYHIDQLTTTL